MATKLDLISNWKEFVMFYLNALEISANESRVIVEKIYDVYKSFKPLIETNFKTIDTRLLELLFSHPYFTRKNMEERLVISKSTANRNIKKLQEIGIVSATNSEYYVNIDLFRVLENME